MKQLLVVLMLLAAGPVTASAEASAAAAVASDLPAPAPFSHAQFTQERRLAALDRPLRSSGTVTFSGAGFVWLQQAPYATSLSYDGMAIVERLYEDDHAIDRIVRDPVTNDLTRTLFQMLSGSWQQMHARFEIQALPADDAVDWSLQLEPRDAAVHRVMPRILLRGHRYVDEILIEQGGGNSTHIELTEHRPLQ